MTESREVVLESNAETLYNLSASILPLWERHIAEAKDLTNQSIEELSAKFANLSQRIHAITNADGQQNVELLVDLIQESQVQLTTVLSLLKKSFEEKDALTHSISSLAANTKQLGSMADTVTQIAKETGMVAVNAAIEAARVGERGRGFAVVADAVKRLSTDAGRTGSHISKTVLEVIKDIQEVNDLSREFAQKDGQVMTEAESIVNHVVGEFEKMAKQVVASSEQMLQESRHVGAEIDQVLVALQFQDRVSQMLTQVCINIERLGTCVLNNDDIGDVAEWLDAFKSTYVMKEQYQIHSGHVAGGSPSKTAARKVSEPQQHGISEITFF